MGRQRWLSDPVPLASALLPGADPNQTPATPKDPKPEAHPGAASCDVRAGTSHQLFVHGSLPNLHPGSPSSPSFYPPKNTQQLVFTPAHPTCLSLPLLRTHPAPAQLRGTHSLLPAIPDGLLSISASQQVLSPTRSLIIEELGTPHHARH